jgi:hypothetical protein
MSYGAQPSPTMLELLDTAKLFHGLLLPQGAMGAGSLTGDRQLERYLETSPNKTKLMLPWSIKTAHHFTAMFPRLYASRIVPVLDASMPLADLLAIDIAAAVPSVSLWSEDPLTDSQHLQAAQQQTPWPLRLCAPIPERLLQP